jgi:hypothetical protein
MITKDGLLIRFCCEAMLDKVLENHIQMIFTGRDFFRVFSGSHGGWEAKAEICPSMLYCPYCGERINKGRQGFI